MKIFQSILVLLVLGMGIFLGYSWQQKGKEGAKENQGPSGQPILTKSMETPSQGPAYFSKTLNAQEEAIIGLFDETAPSVCFITTSNVRRDFWSMNTMEVPRGTGSGFVWDDKGHIVTNYHVIKGADRAQVTLADQTSWDASLVGVAPEKDLAVLKIKTPRKALTPIKKGTSENLRVGQFVMAIGNPFGLDQTLTTGVISALNREIESQTRTPIRGVIQTDAAINPGNSGGPLINSSGELIGVNTAIYSPSGGSAGIGFSIPAGEVNWVIPELIQYGKIKRPSLGIELARSVRGVNGAIVYHVLEESHADKAGIRPTMVDREGRVYLGDVIVALNDIEITNNEDLRLALEKFKVGDEVTLSLIRSNKEIDVKLVLEEPK